MEKEKEIRKIDEGIKLGPEKREIKLEVKGIKIEVEDKEINKFEEEGIKNEIAEEEEEGELFYFESDHLALRGNRDYSEVLKTIFILESIRKRAIKDYEIVAQLHKKALEDPVSFNEKIKNDESLGLPVMFNVPAVLSYIFFLLVVLLILFTIRFLILIGRNMMYQYQKVS